MQHYKTVGKTDSNYKSQSKQYNGHDCKTREFYTDFLFLFKMGMYFVKPRLGPLVGIKTNFQTLANTIREVFSRAALVTQSTLFSSLCKDKSQDQD